MKQWLSVLGSGIGVQLRCNCCDPCWV